MFFVKIVDILFFFYLGKVFVYIVGLLWVIFCKGVDVVKIRFVRIYGYYGIVWSVFVKWFSFGVENIFYFGFFRRVEVRVDGVIWCVVVGFLVFCLVFVVGIVMDEEVLSKFGVFGYLCMVCWYGVVDVLFLIVVGFD